MPYTNRTGLSKDPWYLRLETWVDSQTLCSLPRSEMVGIQPFNYMISACVGNVTSLRNIWRAVGFPHVRFILSDRDTFLQYGLKRLCFTSLFPYDASTALLCFATLLPRSASRSGHTHLHLLLRPIPLGWSQQIVDIAQDPGGGTYLVVNINGPHDILPVRPLKPDYARILRSPVRRRIQGD